MSRLRRNISRGVQGIFDLQQRSIEKTANRHFVKILARHSKKEGRVKPSYLTAMTLMEQAQIVLPPSSTCFGTFFGGDVGDLVVSVLNDGQMTDSRGGGTVKSFHKTLND
jgi:hypothetical protein